MRGLISSSRLHFFVLCAVLGVALHVRGDEPPPPASKQRDTGGSATKKTADEKRPDKKTPRPALPGSRTFLVAIEGDIDLGLAPYVERVLADVGENDAVLFRVNTFGGRIDAAVRIRDAILNTRAYTIGFVDKRAISAG